MTPEEVPDDLALGLAEALNRYETSGLCPLRGACGLCDCGADVMTPERAEEDYRRALDRARYALAAVLPEHKQSVTAGYRRFVKAVRQITKGGEAYQTPKSQGGGGDECTISPPELRQALRDLRDGRR